FEPYPDSHLPWCSSTTASEPPPRAHAPAHRARARSSVIAVASARGGATASVGHVGKRAQREVVRIPVPLDERGLVTAAEGGTVGLVVHADHEVRVDRRVVLSVFHEVIAAGGGVEVLAGAVVHELPVDAVEVLVEVHDDLAEVVVRVGRLP